MIYILGGEGRLGRSLSNAYGPEEAVSLSRKVYENWSREGASDEVSSFFRSINAPEGSLVYVCSGLLDPKLPEHELMRVNFSLPKNVIKGASKAGLRTVTFGTIMEKLQQSENAYIKSKKMLGNFVENLTNNKHLVCHFRLHTLYGVGEPSSFMFLGQILESLKSDAVFEMSSGEQLREYHHIEDDVCAIKFLTSKESAGIMDLNHGTPITLKELAVHLFHSFDRSKLLKVGALKRVNTDYLCISNRPSELQEFEFRETLSSVESYMKNCLQKDNKGAA